GRAALRLGADPVAPGAVHRARGPHVRDRGRQPSLSRAAAAPAQAPLLDPRARAGRRIRLDASNNPRVVLGRLQMNLGGAGPPPRVMTVSGGVAAGVRPRPWDTAGRREPPVVCGPALR